MLLEMTATQFETLKNMVDFATWHAADGMSPALTTDFVDDAKDTAEYLARYAAQEEKIISVRKLLGLEALGDYSTSPTHYIIHEGQPDQE